MKHNKMSLSNVVCKCQDCTDRYVGCHDKCALYLDFKKRLNTAKRAQLYAQRYDNIKTDSWSYIRSSKWHAYK